MVHQDVAAVDGVEHGRFTGKGIARDDVSIVRPAVPGPCGELAERAEIERPGGFVHVGRSERALEAALLESQLALEQLAQRRGHRALDLEAHHGAPRSPPHLFRHRLQEARRPQLVELDVPGACDSEGVSVHDLPAGEQRREPGADHGLDQDGAAVREREEAGQGRWQLDSREVHSAARRVSQGDREAQPPVATVRKRVAWGAGERLGREQGRDLFGETAVEQPLLLRRDLAPVADPDPVRREVALREVAERAVLPRDERVEADGDRIELLGGREPVRRPVDDTHRDLVLQGAHLDHEEVVEVAADDREKPEPRVERCTRVLREREHARDEFERAQVRVNELLRRRGGGLEGARRQLGHAELAERQPAAVVAGNLG